MALVLQHQSRQQFLARLREAYALSSRKQTAQLARFIVTNVYSGDIDKREFRAAFKLDEAKWNTFLRKNEDLLEAYNVIEDAVGE